MIEEILKRIDTLFLELGFLKVNLNNRKTYIKGEVHIRVDYISGFESFVFEYAIGVVDAENNLFEDGDLYPMKLGAEEILHSMKLHLLMI